MSDICEVCGLPKELCVCEEIAREQQKINIKLDKRRYGKMMTVIDGINPHELDVKESKFYTKKDLENILEHEKYVDHSKNIWKVIL